jgi:hypothetical protein
LKHLVGSSRNMAASCRSPIPGSVSSSAGVTT